DAAHGDGFTILAQAFGGADATLEDAGEQHRRLDIARRYAVDADALARVIEGEGAGHLHDGTLRGAIGELGAAGDEGPVGRDIDDGAAASIHLELRDHAADCGAGEAEYRLDI